MSSQINNIQNSLGSDIETENSTTPLMGNKNKKVGASLATPEIDETDHGREVVSNNNPTKLNDSNSKQENTEDVPKSVNFDRNNDSKSVENTQNPLKNTMNEHDDRKHSNAFPHFPTESDFSLQHHRHDLEIANTILEELPDLNVYQHKKTLAQGMMDLALFSANANQLRYVLDSYERHPYYYPSLIFIIISLLLQVAIGVLLIWNATYNVKDEVQVCRANKINNYTVIGIFLVTVVNVFVSAFGVADPPATFATTSVVNTT